MKRILKDDLFSGLSVPDPLDRDTLIGAITVRCGLLTPIYSEPTTMQAAIDQWSKQMQWTFKHLIAIIEAEYSPIENADRYTERTTENTGGVTRTHSGTDTRTETNSGTDTVREGGTTALEHTGDDVTTTKVSAYNATTFQNDNEETTEFGGTDTTRHGKTEATEHGHVITEREQHGLTIRDENDGAEKYTEHSHGNIGIITHQNIITQELELLRKFDVYGWIAQKFESDLCLMIY